MLRLHATPCAFGCGAPPPYDRATATARSLAFGGCSESLTLARVQRSPANATTCVLANAQAFSYPKQYQYPGGLGPWGAGGGGRFEAVEGADDPHGPPARVLAQFTGSDGGTLLVVDRVLRPGGHPLARFPACSLGAALRGAADLQLFSRLLAATGLLGCFDGPGGAADDAGGGVAWRGRGAAGDPPTSCPGGSPWTSRTLFAPTDAAFARLSAGVVAWLFHPDNRPLARLVALVRGCAGGGVGGGGAAEGPRRAPSTTAPGSHPTPASPPPPPPRRRTCCGGTPTCTSARWWTRWAQRGGPCSS